MPRRSSKGQPAEDPNEVAFRVVRDATESGQEATQKKPAPKRKNPAAVALGKRGGKKGGKARAAKLTPERRSEIAKKAAAARWKDHPTKEA